MFDRVRLESSKPESVPFYSKDCFGDSGEHICEDLRSNILVYLERDVPSLAIGLYLTDDISAY
jgi:hypothetical protein